MKIPSDGGIYYMLKVIESMCYQLLHASENPFFDDLPILCELDKASLCLKCAILRMEEILDRKKAKNGK